MAFKRNWDWVPCEPYGQDFFLQPATAPNTEGTITSVQLVVPRIAEGSADQDSAIGQPDVVNGLTIKRVRGHVIPFFFSQDETSGKFQASILIHERIHVGLYDLNDGTIATTVDSLQNAADANERFLWSRTQVHDVSWALGGSQIVAPLIDAGHTHPYYYEVDVSAQRRIQQGEVLLYSATCEMRIQSGSSWDNGVAYDVFLRCNLRTLVRL